jgi:CheY-like chemotaxis protein
MTCVGLSLAKATVLIVDDSPDMRRYLRAVLELDSYQVEYASTGYGALQCLRNGSAPQVILLDMQMPGMDGFETLRRLQEFTPRPKVIVCSGVEDSDKIHEALALGAQAYLVKPIQHLYLSAAIERCLNPASARRQADKGFQPFLLPSPTLRGNRCPSFKS